MAAKNEKNKAQGQCIFCAGSGMSKEHIWSEWMHGLLISLTGRHPSNVAHHIVAKKKVVEINDRKSKQGPLINKRLRVVCEICNSGWMSSMETTAKPALMPLISGDVGELDSKLQAILAQWLVLKTMVVEQNKKDEVVFTTEQRKAFMNDRSIPTGVKIWIGRTYSGRWLSAFLRCSAYLVFTAGRPLSEIVMTTSKNVQTTALGIGQLFVYVMVSNTEGFDLNDIIQVKGPLIRIWPISEEKILIPFHRWIDETAADEVATTLSRFMQSGDIIHADDFD